MALQPRRDASSPGPVPCGNRPVLACQHPDAVAAEPGGRSFPAVEVADKDESHYPYAVELGIGGMSCEHCVAAVTAALDSLPGAWAEVTLAGGQARLRAKRPLDEAAVRSVVEQAGYRLVSFKER